MTTMASHPMSALAASALVTLGARTALAQAIEPPAAPVVVSPQTEAPPAWPRIGGHVGFALPLTRVTNVGSTVIGRDFVNFAISSGVTVKINPHWALDFEFVAYSSWTFARNTTAAASSTTFALDPGVIWNPGPVSLGLRGAIVIGEHVPFNLGVIPIIVKSIPISQRVSWFFELDLPLFVNIEVQQTVVSFGTQLQSGVAF